MLKFWQVSGARLGAGGTEISEHRLAFQELRLMPRSSPSLSGALVSSPPLPDPCQCIFCCLDVLDWAPVYLHVEELRSLGKEKELSFDWPPSFPSPSPSFSHHPTPMPLPFLSERCRYFHLDLLGVLSLSVKQRREA